MNRQHWASWLEESIRDHRLDDDERRYLQSELAEAVMSDEDRSFLRNQSLKLAKNAMTHHADPIAILRWVERIIKVLDNVRIAQTSEVATSWFSPGRSCATGIIEQLKLARASIEICVFTISDDQLTKQILMAHQRGIQVRVITDNNKINDRGSDINYLAESGVPVKIDTTPYHMHHKFAIFDQTRMINGSFNWTRSASKYNQEDITLTDDVRFLQSFSMQFEKLWQQFPCHNPVLK
ncbi:phospholipase D-like domain-containing protein [Vibrio ostreicida]|uniref:phospholipase D n=1 Tax=Vibrio ostreicida TaxID=526588 RepID=A0ABT8BNC5_9VIBR|nr:phospholipase D-like domain-containing protein [Vibrio ostreicida]MDN3608247.1 phospholipase D-like domain-containing protein [Vibrio ostreicida]NPD09769.1 phosphatidylserine synthase [Vibrio ostreicida]